MQPTRVFEHDLVLRQLRERRERVVGARISATAAGGSWDKRSRHTQWLLLGHRAHRQSAHHRRRHRSRSSASVRRQMRKWARRGPLFPRNFNCRGHLPNRRGSNQPEYMWVTYMWVEWRLGLGNPHTSGEVEVGHPGLVFLIIVHTTVFDPLLRGIVEPIQFNRVSTFHIRLYTKVSETRRPRFSRTELQS